VAKAVILAVLAGLFTAASSICQRKGAARAPARGGFTVGLVVHLLRDRLWLMGVSSMILGFACQALALHFGSLALVQPILASELLFVFGYIAVAHPRRVRRGDWLAAAAMALGLGMFLFTAAPSGGREHAKAALWFFGGVSSLGLVVLVAAAAYVPLRRGSRPSPARRAALLGVATGVCWGFLAAVIKELGSHTGHGLSGIFSTWSLYLLVVAGAASMVLAANALQAGPLAASQPGFTIVDPLVASLLGVFIFRDRLQSQPEDLVIEAAALALLALGVLTLSHSGLIHGDRELDPRPSLEEPVRRGGQAIDPAGSAGGAH
jgi:hypothetical protein